MIKRYTWNDSISTGIAEIDLQHKQFFSVFEEFANQLEQGIAAKELRKLLVFLQYYGEWHFGREEGCAARFHCPVAETNMKAHKNYLDTVASLIKQCREEAPTEELAHTAYAILTDWLVNHIMKIDKQIGAEVQQSQLNDSKQQKCA